MITWKFSFFFLILISEEDDHLKHFVDRGVASTVQGKEPETSRCQSVEDVVAAAVDEDNDDNDQDAGPCVEVWLALPRAAGTGRKYRAGWTSSPWTVGNQSAEAERPELRSPSGSLI